MKVVRWLDQARGIRSVSELLSLVIAVMTSTHQYNLFVALYVLVAINNNNKIIYDVISNFKRKMFTDTKLSISKKIMQIKKLTQIIIIIIIIGKVTYRFRSL